MFFVTMTISDFHTKEKHLVFPCLFDECARFPIHIEGWFSVFVAPSTLIVYFSGDLTTIAGNMTELNTYMKTPQCIPPFLSKGKAKEHV